MTRTACRAVVSTFIAVAGLTVAGSIPAAAQVKCAPGAQCRAIDQPSVPAWLALADGKAYFTSQQFEGVVADEYGSTIDADESMYSKSAPYSAAARGFSTPTVQWQRSTDAGGSFADVPGATAATLTVGAVAADANGDRYRAVFTNALGSVTTVAARLTVHYAPAIATQPADFASVPGEAATFTAAGGGNPAPSVQWQISTDGGLAFTDMVGATSGTLTIPATNSRQQGYQFRAVFKNAVGSAVSAAATLSVGTGPAVVRNPTDLTVAAGEGASLHSLASGSPAPSVQWQLSRDGGATFTDVAGATAPDLGAAGLDGDRYRARFTNPSGVVYSRIATLRVRSTTFAGGGSTTINGGSTTINVDGTTVKAGSTVSNSSPAAFVKIRSTVLSVARTGRRARDVRIKLYCDPKAGRDCAGTVKIRTTGSVNPSTTGKKAKPTKVTFITFAYSLRKGAVGIATGRLTTEKMTLLRKLRNLKVDAFVDVTDVGGRSLIVKTTLGMRTVRKSG